MQFHRNLHQILLHVNSNPTSNILETIDSTQKIFSYPATLKGAVDGTPGVGKLVSTPQ